MLMKGTNGMGGYEDWVGLDKGFPSTNVSYAITVIV